MELDEQAEDIASTDAQQETQSTPDEPAVVTSNVQDEAKLDVEVEDESADALQGKQETPDEPPTERPTSYDVHDAQPDGEKPAMSQTVLVQEEHQTAQLDASSIVPPSSSSSFSSSLSSSPSASTEEAEEEKDNETRGEEEENAAQAKADDLPLEEEPPAPSTKGADELIGKALTSTHDHGAVQATLQHQEEENSEGDYTIAI